MLEEIDMDRSAQHSEQIARAIAETDEVLAHAAEHAREYLDGVGGRSVQPSPTAVAGLSKLAHSLPQQGTDAIEVLDRLHEVGSPATVLSNSPRFFGFVAGGTLPVTIGANWLATAWDQLANMRVTSPIACALEDVTSAWIIDLLDLPSDTNCAFTTGTTTSDIVALAGARHAVLARHGWDVAQNGLFGAPPVRVFVAEEVHTTVIRALRILGIGESQITRLKCDNQGRISPGDFVPSPVEPTIMCLQAGNVNTGAFDPFDELIPTARRANAWTHVDGAFGIWAAASQHYSHLTRGMALADSWACDAHKWLNVPYDSGIALFRDSEAVRESLRLSAAYLIQDRSDPMALTLEASRRARGIEVWAALAYLGRSGVARLVDQSCKLADAFAQELSRRGYEILNDVVLNQVLVSLGSDEVTRSTIEWLRSEGTAWFSGTDWNGRAAMRISVSCWSTTAADIDRSADAVDRAVKHVLNSIAENNRQD